MRLILLIAILFSLLPFWPTETERIEIRQRHYTSGQLREEAQALMVPGQDPMYHGLYKSYSQQGVLVREGHYQKGQMNGPWRFWSENGKLVADGIYTDGVGEVTNYGPNGFKLSQGPMDKFAKVGLWSQWYPSGRMHTQGEFVAGKMDGIWSYWADDDNAPRINALFKEGVRQQ